MDYSFKEFQVSDLICLEILINGKRIDALAAITHRNHINHRCKEYLSVLHKMIPRQQFDIVIQAAIGKRIISRLVIKQLRKDVISKCYGGDVTRKKKLILKQKAGKKRMKNIGNVRLPVEVFMTNINMMQYSK